MKKKFLIMLSVIAAAAVVAVASICGCIINPSLTEIDYDDEEKYTVGGGEVASAVTNLDVDWIQGDIVLQYGEVSAPVVEEKANVEIGENLKVRYFADGNTLRIRYAAVGRWDLRNVKKTLTLTLPQDYSINVVKLDYVSCNVKVDGVKLTEISLDCVSGSADITSATLSRVQIDSVSCDFDLRLDALTYLKADCISGNFNIYLPDKGFTATMNNLATSFESEYETVKNDDKYIYGNGGVQLDFDAISCKISVKKLAAQA